MKIDKEKQTVTLTLLEASELFIVIEECQQFLHNPTHFEEDIDKFAMKVYPAISKAYYHTFKGFHKEEE